MRALCAVTLLLCATLSPAAYADPCTSPGCQSAAASLEYLKSVMDQYHNRFPVYDDLSSAGNHFSSWAKIPDGSARVTMVGGSTDNPHSGATTIRAQFDASSPAGFGGFLLLNGILPQGATAPQPNFGTVPNAGIDLSGATALTFWARGLAGGEVIDFLAAGVGRDPDSGTPTAPYPDSSPGVKLRLTLKAQWQQYRIDLTDKDLHYVLGGFGWVAATSDNPQGAVFFLDDIQYELDASHREARLNQPRFLRSYTTLPLQQAPPPVNSFDLVFRNAAYTGDNAMALLAFLADGSADSLRRARLIGQAFGYATQHDRTYHDGRLRDVYSAGDLSLPPGWQPSGAPGAVSIPGYYDEAAQKLVEIGQDGLSSGSNAQAMLALLALYRRTREVEYLNAARGVGAFIQKSFHAATGTYQGFLGGYDGPETAHPQLRPWASTEHNLDLYAAFSALAKFDTAPPTGVNWAAEAEHARVFVAAMWDAGLRCNLAGTTDAATRNATPGQLSLDVQPWDVLAISGALTLHPKLLECAEHNHLNRDQGFTGYDFNEDRDGIWFEGTAHMATAYALARQNDRAEALRQELRRAQATPPFGDGEGIAAASHDGVSTAFGTFLLNRRIHVGATAWNLFAQLQFNPFYAEPIAGGCTAALDALCLLSGRFQIEVNWRDQHSGGRTGFGTTVPISDQTGAFWFFDPANVELIVKILDGRPLNGKFWVFYGALSDVEYTIKVTDTTNGVARTYHNAPGNLCGRGDTGAFSSPSDPASVTAETEAREIAVSLPDAPGPCAAGTRDLCLLGSRFQVAVHWKNQHAGGAEGEGTAVPSTDQTGYFWFFDPANLELVVKVLDGRGLNGHFWVFYGALSDVEYTITVTDTVTGTSKTYHNLPGSFCGRGDTTAF